MIFKLLLPYIWSVIGYWVVDKIDLRALSSKLMLYALIPYASFYAFSFYKGNLYNIMICVAIISMAMYIAGLKLFQSKNFKPEIVACVFGYFNLGWLGIPIASVIFGNQGALIMTAAYMVGQLYGNTIAVASFQSLASHQASPLNNFRKLLVMPATYTMIFGMINRETEWVSQYYFEDVFTVVKWLMTVFGMGLIGMSLRKSQLNFSDYKIALRVSLYRYAYAMAVVVLTLLGFYGLSQLSLISISSQELLVLTMMVCLPVGANVVVLEFALLNTGKTSAIVAMTTFLSVFFLIIYALVLKLAS